jgi:hypothetical protein
MPTRPTSGYDNEEIPDSLPLQNRGAIPVLVRLVDGELGEHYRPAEARRWTETHVMVGLYRTDPDTGRRTDQLAWLRAEDVYRVLRPEDVHEPPTRPTVARASCADESFGFSSRSLPYGESHGRKDDTPRP